MKHFVSTVPVVCSCLLLSVSLLAQPTPPQSLDLPNLVAPVYPEELVQQLSQCLGHPVVILEQRVSGREDRLAVELEPFGESALSGERFSANMRYNEAAGRWEPVNFLIAGQLNSPDWGGRRIGVQGLVSSGEAEALHAVIDRYWEEHSDSARIRITSITSSRRPDLSCQYDSLEPRAPEVRYQVMATNSALPAITERVDLPRGRILEISDQPMPPHYLFHLRQDAEGGPLQVIGVSCESRPFACDEQILVRLQAGSSAPQDPLENADLRLAMLNMLPPAFRYAEIRDTQSLWRGDRETVVIQLGSVAISDLRKAGSLLACHRFLSKPTEWECEHRIGGQTQAIPELDLEVRMTGRIELSEEEVIQLVDNLFANIGRGRIKQLLLSRTPEGGFHVRYFSTERNGNPMRQAWFSSGLELERLE